MGISADAMKKLVNDKMFELKIRIDKDPKFKEIFTKNFELAYDDDGLNIKVLSNYKSTIPEKYRNLIYDHFEGPYTNKISKGFKFFSGDIEDKTADYLFEYLKDNCERHLNNFQSVDSEISQYLSLLGKGYILSTCWGRCQCVRLIPGQIEEYLKYVNEYYPVKDSEKYRDKIISTFADYAKRNNIEAIEYNNPAVEVELPHIFNEEYEKREERTRKNKECSQVISEITRKMHGDYNRYDEIKVFTNENQAEIGVFTNENQAG